MEQRKKVTFSENLPKNTPKTPPTNRKPRVSKLSQEQLRVVLEKKKKCNTRAQKIIEEAIEPLSAEKMDYFLSNLIHLNQSHYDDIVEERAITKLCGYPLCVNKLGDVLKQQYKISLAKHKVFDITERKSFCSDQCYKASLYLKEQILTSPLWVRAEEDILPEFKLLNLSDDEKQNKVKIPEMKSVELPVAKTKC